MKRLAKGVRLSLPVWLLPVAFLVYAPLNALFFVRWLGCSCPVMNAQGELVPRVFCANDLTLVVSIGLAAAALAVVGFNLRRFSDAKGRLLYIVVCLLCILPAAYAFVTLQYWK